MIFGSTGFVNAPLNNTVGLETAGVDMELKYRTSVSDLGMGEMGSLEINPAGAWTVKDGLTIRAGINDVFDRDAPIVDNGGFGITGNANTFVGQFDTLGRMFFLGVTADF